MTNTVPDVVQSTANGDIDGIILSAPIFVSRNAVQIALAVVANDIAAELNLYMMITAQSAMLIDVNHNGTGAVLTIAMTIENDPVNTISSGVGSVTVEIVGQVSSMV